MWQLGEDQYVVTADPENESHQVLLQTGHLFHDKAYGKHELQLLKQSLNTGHPELSSSGKTRKDKTYTNTKNKSNNLHNITHSHHLAQIQ